MGVLIYYKIALPKKKIEIIFLPESICFKRKRKRKIWIFLSFYRTLTQIQVELEEFSETVYSILDHLAENNKFKVIAVGNFNTKLKKWYYNDIKFQRVKY